ncbi:hypothetical protein GE061_004321 [Apolygus lucorum]|uniref:Uncharacterized protein n=1 Tax=Apolygus lucorum TaxID=248454 RepID=A0A8S9X2V0_APOLU|nr:hypothetical protein GE061_004321 [Apolygus lucorum]
MLGMCRPAGISLVLVLVACQQSASGESGQEWKENELGYDDHPNDKSKVSTSLKDMPKEEREKWLGYVDRAMKLHDKSFHPSIKNGIPPPIHQVHVDLLQVLGERTKKFIFKDDKFSCVLIFYVKDGAVGIKNPAVGIKKPPKITGMCVPLNFGNGEIWNNIAKDAHGLENSMVDIFKKALKRTLEKSKQ